MCVGWLEIQGASAGEMASAPPPLKAADGANSTRGAGFMGALNRFLRFRGNRVRSNGGTPGFSNTTGGWGSCIRHSEPCNTIERTYCCKPQAAHYKVQKDLPMRHSPIQRGTEYLSRYGIR